MPVRSRHPGQHPGRLPDRPLSRAVLTGVAFADGTVWGVGSAFDPASGNQLTLVARNDGAGWRQVAAPNPGTGDKVLGAISAAGDTAWTADYFKTATGRTPLIELHQSR